MNNALWGAGNNILIGGGGGGDNTFYVDPNDTAIAGAGDGIDTIVGYWGSLTLPAGFTVGSTNGPSTLTGNNLNDILIAEIGYAQTIVGGSGNDLMIGATSGQDRFIVDAANHGSAAIENFVHGSDVVQLNNYSQFAAGFSAVKAAMTQAGSNVVLNLGGNASVTFTNQTVAQFTASDFAIPLNTASMKLTFDDEFNSLSASANGIGATWQFMSGTLSVNHEAENYLASTTAANSPFSDSNGVLTITASPISTAAGLSYTSGGLTTAKSFSQTYGLFEVNAEMPAGAGMWPAFWLLPANGSSPQEIDAPEVLGSDPTTIYLSVHSAGSPTTTTPVKVANTSTGFHTYGVDWEPNAITYYFDGNAIASMATPAGFNTPMYMLLNLAVGGTGSWPGAATGETGQMLVNWVRVYSSATTIAAASVAPAVLTLNGWNTAVTQGAGTYIVTGNGYNGNIKLGDGNQTITLNAAAGQYGASADTITTGNGNQTISTNGSYNTITTGSGVSNISAGVSGNTVTIGATPSGSVSQLSASGWGNSFNSLSAGTVTVTALGGGSVVHLGDGNQTVNLGSSYNSVVAGAGNSIINGGIGQDNITTGAGSSTITVSGWNNILDAGPGTNVLNGGSGNDVFILNAAGQGTDTITGMTASNGDQLDFTNALKGLGALATSSSFSKFVTSTATSAGTTLSIDTTGHGGAGQVVAHLNGLNTSVAGLISAHEIKLGSTVF